MESLFPYKKEIALEILISFHVELIFNDVFIVENQPYKEMSVQLSIREMRTWKSCFEGMNGLDKACVLIGIFD